MGNYVGTIRWSRVKEDAEIYIELEKLRNKYSLTVDDQWGGSSTLETSVYSAEARGMNTSNAEARVKAFLYDATDMIEKRGMHCEARYQHLPM